MLNVNDVISKVDAASRDVSQLRAEVGRNGLDESRVSKAAWYIGAAADLLRPVAPQGQPEAPAFPEHHG